MDQTTRSESAAVIEIRGLTRRFGSITALDDVDLAVPRGSVFGLVGVNGAGKTTLLKHVLGLLRAEKGSVRVFGLDPVAEPVGVLSRIGYLAEGNDLPGWMRVNELVRYTSAFYPTWDDAYAKELCVSFDLEGSSKVRHLSKGQRARAGLLVALAFRPEILVLDEPSSGLDPIIRRDILGAIIRTISEEGRTVLFSSHLLDEVERVSDHVAMIHDGRIVICGQMDQIKTVFHRVTVRFNRPLSGPPSICGALAWKGAGQEWTTIWGGQLDQFARMASNAGARIVDKGSPSLDEIFVARVGAGGTVAKEV